MSGLQDRPGRRVGRRRLDRLLATVETLADAGGWELDLESMRLHWTAGMYRIYGLEPGETEPTVELVSRLTHPADRPRIDEFFTQVAGRPEGMGPRVRDGEYRIVRPDGVVREIRGRGQLELEDGVPRRWVGSAQDVTDQRLAERELHAHYALTQALNDWESFDQGTWSLLRRLGTALGFPMGAIWTWDRATERIVCRSFWTAPGEDAGAFERTTRAAAFREGDGVPGRVWRTQEPLAGGELRDSLMGQRRKAAAEIGLRTGVAFPAVAEGRTLAVLSFYSFHLHDPRRNVVRTLVGIGHELGRFLLGRRAELDPRTLSDRELEVLRLAAAGNTSPRIAEQLVVSPATVKTHFDHIFQKLEVSDRAAAVAVGFRLGLLR